MPHLPHRLEVENASIGYGQKIILRDISFQVPNGARVAVVGPNGAGKSTLFKALVGLLPLHSGRILIHGVQLGDHQDCVAYVPQREEVDWRFPVTVRDVVMMGRYGKRGWLRRGSSADREAVEKALAQMGIGALAAQSISDLSRGQQQRVFLARALAQEPHIVLMDEPFSGMDVAAQGAALDLLDDLHEHGVTAVISTHDLNVAASRFDYVLLLNRRLVAFGTPEDVMRQQHLTSAYGNSLVVLENGTVLVDECCPPDEEHGDVAEAVHRHN
jgi:manganese/iron transport system ATP-binding protein